MKKLKQIQNIWVIGASVTFCFTFLIVNITAGKVNAQEINSPSTNSQSEALAKAASNGVVLIKQKSALAGKITPGDTPGFPVTISQSGSYSLSSNLTVPANTNGIVIQADNVTIDLNGFNITGGIHCIDDNQTAHTRITIRNGTIAQCSDGINLSQSTQVSIKQIQASSNGNGIVVGENSIVSGNIASENNSGIVVGKNSTVSGNTASRNTLGISVGENSTVSGNTASENNSGMHVNISSTVSENTISGNTTGLFVFCPSNIVGNTAVGNTSNPISEDGSGCTRANNNPAP